MGQEARDSNRVAPVGSSPHGESAGNLNKGNRVTKRQRGDGKATQEFRDKVLRAMPLPPAWVTGKQMYHLFDTGSMEYIKNALRQLVADGKVCKFGPRECPAFRRIDLPEFKPDKNTLALIRQYQRDLAEWKGR